MPLFDDIHPFADVIEPASRLIGCDLGRKKIGVALSDTSRMIATPCTIIHRKGYKQDFPALFSLLDEHQATGLVVGFPLSMDGEMNESCMMVGKFCEALLEVRDVPIYLQDERLSTVAVSRVLSDTGMTRKKRQSMDDKLAAGYLLQTALDRLAML